MEPDAGAHTTATGPATRSDADAENVTAAQNAVQACPTDGSGRVRLGVARTDGEVLVTIRDTGPGIDAATLEKIWTPFYTTKQQGTGLGLAFVRDIAIDHGARIAVESQPGGTTFTLTLPESA